MKSATHLTFVAPMLVLAFSLVGTSALRGQDVATASSVVPPLIKFNGVLTAPGAQNRTSDSASMGLVTATFSLYGLQEGGAPLWSEVQKVQLDEQGQYVVILGAASPGGLPLDLFTSGKALWLGVQPQLSGAGELPRVLLAAVPYALKAVDSETLGGKPASAYALAGAPTTVEVAGIAAPSSASATSTSAGGPANAAGSTSSPQPLTACTAVTSDGAATANTVAKFTTACNIENSLIRDTGTGVAVGGTATPGALLDVQFASTAATGSLLGQRALTTLSPTATSTASADGLFSNLQTATGNTHNFFGNLYALNSELDHYGTGKVTSGFGLNGAVVNQAAGTITNAYGVYASLSNASTGTITNGYGVYVNAPSNTGTFSKFTGLYIASPTAVVPGAYGVYSAGGTNYFNGSVGIGTTTPGAVLEVNGTAKFDGLVTFKAGQTYPGAGTVTSVATGAGLKGGPITKTGTLSIATAGVTNAMLANPSLTILAGADLTGGGAVVLGGGTTLGLDTTKVPQLGTANTFAGTQTISSGDLALPSTTGAGGGVITLNGVPFVHSYGDGSNTFVGGSSGNFSMNSMATENTGSGGYALASTTTGHDNAATGYKALWFNTTGYYNTAAGADSLFDNTTGYSNTGVGEASLSYNTTASNNTAVGGGALFQNCYNVPTACTASNNTAVGVYAGVTTNFANGNITGANDTFIGYNSGPGTSTQLNNATAIGANAWVSASNALVLGGTGGNAVKVGIGTPTPQYTLDVQGTGNFSGPVTFAAGQTFPGAGTVTSVGSGAGLTGGPITTSGTLSIAAGGVTNAMLANPSLTILAGTDLTGGGVVVLGGGTTLGLDTTKVPQLGTPNTFAGTQTISGGNLALPNTTGSGVGVITLGGNPFAHSFGSFNTFVGQSAGNFTMTGASNTASGDFALQNNKEGSYNTASGVSALLSSTSGNDNTASGDYALQDNKEGSDNTAIGIFALSANTSGVANTAVGEAALGFNCYQYTGYDCPGVNNTAVGYDAGSTTNLANANKTGANNTFIGFQSGPGTSTQLNNATAIGANAVVSASNSLVLGSINGVNSATSGVNVGIGTASPIATLQIDENNAQNADTLLIGNNSTKGLALFDYGSGVDIESFGVPLNINYAGNRFTLLNTVGSSTGYVGIGTGSPDNMLTVNGSADKPGGGSWGTFSDARLKTVGDNFRAGLPKVLKLNPIYYRYKENNALGIADRDEHVGFVAQEVEKVIPEAVTKDSQGYRIVNNDPILWAMLNAIKQQQGLIQEQAEEIKAQQEQIGQLVSRTRVIQDALAGKSAPRPSGVLCTYTANGKQDISMTAEEVGKVMAEVVSYEDNGKDARGIDYARLIALLVEAVKQQQSGIQQERSQIRGLEAKVRRLEVSKADAVQPAAERANTAARKGGK